MKEELIINDCIIKIDNSIKITKQQEINFKNRVKEILW